MPILVKVENVPGSTAVKVQGYNDGNWFQASSFAFGMDREMSESGERGGTEDINIGVGDLGNIVITKALDGGSPRLAQFGVNGNSPGDVEIHFVKGPNNPKVLMIYKLDRAFVKSWSTSGDGGNEPPTETVAFYFNRIAFAVAGQPQPFSWNRVAQTSVWDHQLPVLPAIP
jgi:type VI protein secretion system component Hcp